MLAFSSVRYWKVNEGKRINSVVTRFASGKDANRQHTETDWSLNDTIDSIFG